MKKIIIILFFSIVFSACGGGGDAEPEAQASIRIDNPSNHYSTGSDVARLDGNTWMLDGSYPDTVYWYSNYTSGVAGTSVICIISGLSDCNSFTPSFIEATITDSNAYPNVYSQDFLLIF